MEISGHRTRSIFDRYNIVSERDKQDDLRRTHDYLGSASKKLGVAVMRKAAADAGNYLGLKNLAEREGF
jgi:hypothetical protein